MGEDESKNILKNILKCSNEDMVRLNIFENMLLEYNIKYNLISKATEALIWSRHILDSAQLINLFQSTLKAKLVDFGSGAGFPGLVIAILNKNPKIHVNLYDKSPVKRDFLQKICKKLHVKAEIKGNIYENKKIDADIIVSRAFKKLDQIIKISREMILKNHKIIILKGKNAQKEINNLSLGENYSYKLENSITNTDSKIIIIDAKKNE